MDTTMDADSIPSQDRLSALWGTNLGKNLLEQTRQALLVPQIDFSRDDRDLYQPVATQLDRAKATVKLEQMNHIAIVRVTAVLYFSLTVALVVAVTVAILSNEFVDNVGVTLTQSLALFAIEGLARTVAAMIVLFATVTYPFRVLDYAKSHRRKLLPEQTMLSLILIVISCTPGFSLYSPILYWRQYADTLAYVMLPEVQVEAARTNVTDGSIFSLFFFSKNPATAAVRVSIGLTVITIAASIGFFGLVTFFLGQPNKLLSVKKSPAQQGLTNDEEKQQDISQSALLHQQQFNESSDSDLEENALNDSSMITTIRDKDVMTPKRSGFLICFRSFRSMIIESEKIILGLCTAYIIIFMTLFLVYDTLPSQIPFVGMITLLKVCPYPIPARQAKLLNLSTSTLACNPIINNGQAFQRAMCYAAQFVAEFIMFYYLHYYIVAKTRIKLRGIPYESARDKHLGFRYLNSTKRVTFFFVMVMSIIMASTVPATMATNVVYQTPNSTLSFVTYYSPLAQVGINFFTLGFGPAYLCLASFLFMFSTAYLPPDSQPGVAGFLCGGYAVLDEQDLDHPAYILQESDVQKIRRSRELARRKLEKQAKKTRRVRAARMKQNGFSMSRKPHMFESDLRDQAGEVMAGVGTPTSAVAASAIIDPEQIIPGDEDDESLKVFLEQYQKLSKLLIPKWERVKEHTNIVWQKMNDALMNMNGGNATATDAAASAAMHPPNAWRDMSCIAEQLNANLFCLETEVLLLNFAFVAYCLGSYTDENPVTKEEKQKLVDDSRYEIVSHIENAKSEIQCAIFRDLKSERIFVTFRGTSTKKNIWQDIDYIAVVHEDAKQVQPVDFPNEQQASKRAAAEVPKVHRGFYFAYLSIKVAVMAVLSDLIENAPDKSVVFTCGHSLGGALAIHLAFDLAMKYPIADSKLIALQCTTFGSPRVGNFSFVSRHRKIVPTLHRFCVGGDPVSKLPPAQHFSDFTKYGYHHVGVEILLDVLKVNLILGPSFIERQIQHGWGGYVPRYHVMGSYVLTLMFWCARVHSGAKWRPNWFLCVVNHILKSERHRIKKILEIRPNLASCYMDQVNKEGAVQWTDDNRALVERGCETDTTAGTSSLLNGAFVNMQEKVFEIDNVLGMFGVPSSINRYKYAQILVSQGYDSLEKLKFMTRKQLIQCFGSVSGENLYNEDFARVILKHIALNRCFDCDFHPLVCPRCGGAQAEVAAATTGVAEGSVLAAEGSVLAAEGPVLAAKGSVLAAEGSVLAAEGPVLAAEGPVLAAEGPVLAAEGSVLLAADGLVMAAEQGKADAKVQKNAEIKAEANATAADAVQLAVATEAKDIIDDV